MADELARERDFYRSLLELAGCASPEPLVRRALDALVTLTSAREAYIELRDPGTLGGDDEEGAARWWAAEGCDAVRVDAIRAMISRGIVAEALATGETVLTASAKDDDRFRERGSVRANEIEAVLCAPIGRETPLGVVYLQGQRATAGPRIASEAVRDQVELLARAIEPIAALLLRREEELRAVAAPSGPFAGVITRAPVVRELVARLTLVAPLDVHVLVSGPSGAGKTLLASAIHVASARRARPFVELNCAAIPETLLENELFGADPGAHSAVPRGGVRGKVDAAEGGTLFLDEIGELALSSQAKLLQLLQDRTYYRLGSAVARRADVRIVAATNVDLARAVQERRFREDLYYRLKVFEARVPGLDERPEDLMPLAVHFARTAASRHDLPQRALSPRALRAIQTTSWPGHVRELGHRVESAVLHAHLRGASAIEPQDVFPERASLAPGEDVGSLSLQEATRRFQRAHVLAVLESTDWNVSEAARRLDLARSHLYTLIQTHGLRRG